MMGKKKDKIKRKAREKLARAARTVDRQASKQEAKQEPALRTPDYPDSAQAVQRMPKDDRKQRSPITKKTIRAMHREINRRVASVGEEGLAMLDTDVTDHTKFVTLTRQTGNIGDTLASFDPAPELVRSELIRVMAIAGLWAQSLAGKRSRR